MTNSADPDGFFRSQLIWIYTVCKSKAYLGSAGPELTFTTLYGQSQQMTNWYFSYFSQKLDWFLMKSVVLGDNLHEMSKPIVWEK